MATTTEDAFSAWVSDRAAGLDAIMLAPTRNLVAELNRRARAHRLDHSPAASEVRLADGNRASVGDVIITRSNDRRLRLTATDWVKNGDRWTITACRQTRRPDRPAQPQPPHRPAARRLRPRLDRSRLCHHHPFRPRRLRRHHARPVDRAGVPAAAVHHAHPRPARQPPLPPSRRRRRPPHPHPTRHHLTAHADRDAAADPRPRRSARLRQHLAARAQQPSGPALPGGPALHRRPPRRSRTARRTPDRRRARPSRPVHPRAHRPNPPGRPCEPTCSPSRPKPGSTHSATC